MFVAQAQPTAAVDSGLLLTLLLVGAVPILWPLYRRVLRGIGLTFMLFGLAIGAVAAAGSDQSPSEVAGFLLGGAALRVVGGFRPVVVLRRRWRHAHGHR